MIDIEYIATLSKLDLNAVKKYADQMTEMILLADEIVSAEGALTAPVVTDYCNLRKDIPKPFNSEIPVKNDFTVPKII